MRPDLQPWIYQTKVSTTPSSDRSMAERSEEHTSELQSPCNLVCRLLLEKKKKINTAVETMYLPPLLHACDDVTAGHSIDFTERDLYLHLLSCEIAETILRMSIDIHLCTT